MQDVATSLLEEVAVQAVRASGAKSRGSAWEVCIYPKSIYYIYTVYTPVYTINSLHTINTLHVYIRYSPIQYECHLSSSVLC
jgi:hypothetical protein